MSNASMKILRPLPPAPKPTRAYRNDDVQGIAPKHLEVRPHKPPVVPRTKRAEKTPAKPKPKPREKHYPKEAHAAISRGYAKRKARAIELYRQGFTNHEIAEKMGLGYSTVSAYTHEVAPQNKRPRGWLDASIIPEYEAGTSYHDMAEMFGVDVAYISHKLSKLRKKGLVGRRYCRCEH